MTDGPTVLGRILARTRERLNEKKRQLPLERILSAAPTPGNRRSFRDALARPDQVNVIAEFKRRSPSKGILRDDLHPVTVAQGYEIAGAVALSVLTDEEFFGGTMDDLQQARSATLLPTLRKDFIVDSYQVREAWISGADAILLIVAALSEFELKNLHTTAAEARIDALVEVHDQDELDRALAIDARIIGVNSRNLKTMDVDLGIAFSLIEQIPDDVVVVAESGIRSGAEIRRLRDAGFDAFLIGEYLMTSPDPGVALEALLAEAEDV